MVNLYDDLKEKVDAAGFKMKTVCEKAGVSSGTPSHWASKRTTPNQRTYDKIVKALCELANERAEKMKGAGVH